MRLFISAIAPIALFPLLIRTEDPRPIRPNINLAPITFLSLLPTGKEADNQNIY